jgi:hypothetical protein
MKIKSKYPANENACIYVISTYTGGGEAHSEELEEAQP